MRRVRKENVVRTVVEKSDEKSVMLELWCLCSEWLLREENGGSRGMGGMKTIK